MSIKFSIVSTISLCFILITFPLLSAEVPTVEEQMNALKGMCKASSDTRNARHQNKPLYERLGGYEKIVALTTEILRLHHQNDAIKSMFANIDNKLLTNRIADFLASGTGGNEKYTGRSLPDSHVNLNITDAHFLTAGADIMQSMKNLQYGQDEADEVLCILVSLKDQVVLK